MILNPKSYNDYETDPSTTTFALGFDFDPNVSSIGVKVRPKILELTLWEELLPEDYRIDTQSAIKTITLTNSKYLREGYILRIYRITDRKQLQSFSAQTRYGDATEYAIDSAVLMIQEEGEYYLNLFELIAQEEIQLKALRNHIDKILPSLEAIGQQLDKFSEDLASETSRVTSLESNLFNLEHTVFSNSESIGELERETRNLRENTDTNTESIEGLESETSKLREDTNANTESIEGLESETSKLRQDTDANMESIKGLESETSKLRQDTDANMESIKGLDTETSKLREDTNANTESIEGLESETSKLRQDTDANMESIKGLDTETSKLREDTNANTESITEIKKELIKIRTKTESNTDDIGKLYTDLMNFEQEEERKWIDLPKEVISSLGTYPESQQITGPTVFISEIEGMQISASSLETGRNVVIFSGATPSKIVATIFYDAKGRVETGYVRVPDELTSLCTQRESGFYDIYTSQDKDDSTTAHVSISTILSVRFESGNQATKIPAGFLQSSSVVEIEGDWENIDKIEDNSLYLCNALQSIPAGPRVTQIGIHVLSSCDNFNGVIRFPRVSGTGDDFLSNLANFNQPVDLPEVLEIGRNFLTKSNVFNSPVSLPKCLAIADSFMTYCPRFAESLELKSVRSIGVNFLMYSGCPQYPMYFRELTDLGDGALSSSTGCLMEIYMPRLTRLPNDFLNSAQYSSTQFNLYFESVNTIGDNFCKSMQGDKARGLISLPAVQVIGNVFLMGVDFEGELSIPNVEEVGSLFLASSSQTSFWAPLSLTKVGSSFLSFTKMRTIVLNNIEQMDGYFAYNCVDLVEVRSNISSLDRISASDGTLAVHSGLPLNKVLIYSPIGEQWLEKFPPENQDYLRELVLGDSLS